VTAANALQGFRVVAVVREAKFTLVRLAAPEPRPVTDATLRAARLGGLPRDRVEIRYQAATAG
jgi:hypothetical protein